MAHCFRIGALIALSLWFSTGISSGAQSQSTSAETETLLAKAVEQINAQQPNEALDLLNQLIQRYPNFQLAQMIRADLLLAQSTALSGMGAQLSIQQTQALQAEAKARLEASKHLASHQQPAYLLASPPNWLAHLLVIDLSSSRAYLFNRQQQQLVFSTSFYITQGSKGAGKEKEGDKRTPIGIYRIQKPIPAQKLSGFYGVGALPLDYPNSWDQRNRRTGHGIWLHGTPFEQYSRPPLASDGCLVLSNDDMGHLLTQLNWQKTRIITDQQLKWTNPENTTSPHKLEQRIEAWRQSWEQQQTNTYLGFYAANFTSHKGENKAQWSVRKQQLFALAQPHRIHVAQLLLLAYPSESELVVAEFEQSYQRAGKIEHERKRLWWQQQQGEWLIVHEEILSN